MGRRSKNVRDRLLVGILSLAMLLTGVTMPTGTRTAQAADETIDLLNGSSITKTGTVAKDNYGDDLFCEEQFAGLGNELLNNGSSGYSNLKFEATVKVNSCSKGNPAIVLYAMNKSYGGWKDIGAEVRIGTAQTVSLDLMSFSSFSRVGIRFTQCEVGTEINYTISSAKIIGTKSSGTGSGNSGTVEGERIEGVSASVNYLPANSNQYYSEYNLTVKNNSSSSAENFLIKIPVSGNTKDLNLQAYGSLGGTPRYSDGYIIIRFTQTVAAGATFSSGDGKFGFNEGPNVVLGTPVVIKDDGSFTSASQLKYELTGQTKNVAYADTPVGKHGKLELKEMAGYSTPIIVDKNGKPFQLRGASTHGMHWDGMHQYVNKAAFQSLRDEWGVNMVRLVSYITQGGYTEGSQAHLDSKIQEGVEAAKELGMYVLIDWHVHAEDPHVKKDWAEKFFQKYATMYKDYDNVLFEICNEPTGVNWYNNGSGGDLYSYCKDICTIIRNAGSNALIVCGTNTWSQDVDQVAQKPLKNDGFKNILYTFHFYAASHYEDKMSKVRTAIAAGTPIFVTEFGICSADGNGTFDTGNADAWIKLCDENNISYACWSLCNKAEAASYLLPSSSKRSGWTEEDLATTGIWLVNTYRAHQDKEDGTDTGKGEATPKPSSSAKPNVTPTPKATPTPRSSAKPTTTPPPKATPTPR
ncbi:MAG: glycoside hydrolase family 5 protein, partial [Lachnospiraceae bacterium]|nr:glycoside hydrolase family 5 protein [Lachnospiraceae bacterium]